MKVHVQKQKPQRVYPYVAAHEESGGVVMFTGPRRGVLLKESSAYNRYKFTGENEEGWAEELFTPCTVTITND